VYLNLSFVNFIKDAPVSHINAKRYGIDKARIIYYNAQLYIVIGVTNKGGAYAHCADKERNPTECEGTNGICP